MNNVELSGKIYRPTLKFLPKGTAVFEASIGVSRKVGEEWKTEFFDLVSYGKTAEELAEKLTDKTAVSSIRGLLRQEKWTDKESGKERSRVRVVVFEAVKKEAEKAAAPPVDDDIPF